MSRFQWLPIGSPFEEKPFRRVFERVRRPLPPDPEIVTAYTDGQVTLRSNRSKEGYHEAADLSGFQGVEVGDFVVHGLDILRGSVGVADSAGALSSVCIVCVPRVKSDPRFFAYAMRAQAWAGVPRALAKGVREGGADFRRWETLADLPLPVPSLPEQRAIADYLDTEIARIDALISRKHRLLDVLAERRQAEIITAMVTKHPTDHRPLRAYAEVQLGRQRTPAHDTGPNMTAYLRAVNVQDGRLDLSDVKSMDFDVSEQARFSLEAGDVLVTEGSGSLASIGATAVWNDELDATVCFQNTLLRLRPRRMTHPRFLAWWCRYAYASGLFAGVATGANIFHLSADRVRSLPMTHVPLTVQRTIADYLDTEIGRIEAIINKERRVLDLLAERRQALITAMVTGDASTTAD